MILQLIYFEHEFVLSYINYVYRNTETKPDVVPILVQKYFIKIKITIKVEYIFRGPDTIIFSFGRSLPPKYFY